MLRLTTLGSLDLRDRLGRPVRDVLSQPKRIALLVLLAVEGRRGPVPRDRVVAMFWPESDEARARNALSQSLYHLRQAIGADLLVSQGTTLELAQDHLWCDALVLEDALAAGDAELALDLYKGEFCPALHVSGASAVEDWVSATRREQRRRLLDVARAMVTRLETNGDAASAARVAKRALALAPDDERDVRAYLSVVERGGDLTGALALYAEYARRIAAELETEPSPETVALVEQMKRRRSAAVARAVTFRDGASDVPTSDDPEQPVERRRTTPPGGTRPPAEARAPARHASRRNALLAIGALLLVTWGITARARLGAAADPSRGTVQAIAVFPFTVRGVDSTSLQGDGMSDLLAATLGGVDELRAIDPRSSVIAAEGRTPDPARGAQLGRTLGAQYFVLGDLVERAGQLQMNGSLYATAHPRSAIATASVTGDTAALFQLVDDLAGRLLASLLEGRDTALTQLAAVTTSSLPALKAYLRGERAMRDGLDAKAAAAFREASEIDTSFALAQYRLALVANWISVPGLYDPLVYAARAANHADRLSPLGRDLLEAFRAYKGPEAGVEQRYRAIVQAYPDNVEAWYMLGESQFHYGPFAGHPSTEARAAFERVLQLQPSNLHAQLHLARIAAKEGQVEEVDSLTAHALTRFSEAERIAELRMLRAVVRRDSVEIATAFDSLADADEIVLYSVVQSVIAYGEDLDLAGREVETLLRTARSSIQREYAVAIRALLPLARGEWRTPIPSAATDRDAEGWRLQSEVLAAVEPVVNAPRALLLELRARVAARRPWAPVMPPSRPLPAGAGEAMRLQLLALLDLRLGDLSSAHTYMDSLDRLDHGPVAAFAGPYVAAARAEELRLTGKPAEALAAYERIPMGFRPEVFATTNARERFARAELLSQLGRDEEARRFFASFPASYDLAFIAPARLREAELLERAGQRADARTRYERVLALYRHADPALQPLVQRAREGLARTR